MTTDSSNLEEVSIFAHDEEYEIECYEDGCGWCLTSDMIVLDDGSIMEEMVENHHEEAGHEMFNATISMTVEGMGVEKEVEKEKQFHVDD